MITASFFESHEGRNAEAVLKNKNKEEAAGQIEWIIKARWTVLIVLFALGIIAHTLNICPLSLELLLSLAFVVCAYNFLCFFLLRREAGSEDRALSSIKYVQVAGDIAILTAFIHFTGGPRSPFFVLYILTIIVASILLSSRETYYTAVVCAFLYGGLLLLEHYQVIPDYNVYVFTIFSPKRASSLLYFTILVASTIFCTTAYLGTHLSIRFKEAKTALQDMEWYHYKFIQEMSTAVMVANEDGKIVVFNKAAQKITGFSSSEMIDRMCSERHEDDAPLSKLTSLVVKALKENKEIKRGEVSVSKKDGETTPIGFNISLLKNSEGKVMGAVLIFADLSEVKTMENRLRLKDRLSDLGGLAATIAHEIRNPLNLIKMFAQLIESSLDQSSWKGKAQAIEDIKSISSQADMCEQVIRELLVFTRPSAIADATGPEEIRLDDFLNTLLKDYERSEQFSAVQLEKSLSAGEAFVWARHKQLRHIFVNLVENGAQAIHDGGKLAIRTKTDAGTVEIEITDDGPGIPADVISHIFEPFYTTREEGTGLGLAIVQKIVLELDGTIEVESKRGEGTTFRVRLPAKEKSPCVNDRASV